MRRHRFFLSAGGILVAAVAALASAALAGSPPDAGAILPATAPMARIRTDLAFLADDALEGREAGSRGHRAAADFVADRFRSLGLEPGADGNRFQQVPLRFARRNLNKAEMTLVSPDGARETLVHLEDFIISRSLAARAFAVEAQIVFAGYGVVDAAAGYNDYGSIDARGKIVVVFSGAPATFGSEQRAFLGDGDTKRVAAAARGAIGLITVPTKDGAARTPWPRVVMGASSFGATWIGPDGDPFVEAPEIAAGAFMSASGAQKLFTGAREGFDALQALQTAGKPLPTFDLPRRAVLRGASKFKSAMSPNVIGVIEGSDPALANEAVVVTAHLDHLANRKAKTRGEDVINNGAMDNAMGVALMIEAARKLTHGRPRRSVVFIAVTAEEKGLLGAGYFARYPTLGSKKIVANVNLDMPLTLYPLADVVAFGAERSSLGPVVKAAAEEMGLALTPDPFPEEGIFTRSDHFRFVEQGVPSIFLFSGVAGDGREIFADFLKNHYHKPSDDLSLPIDYAAAAKFAELNADIVRRIADADDPPRWNEGDFFGGMFAR